MAIIRNNVFTALRRLSPAKLEGRDKGNLISIITSDIELLEVFYAHTISPIIIASFTSIIMIVFIGQYHTLLGLLALTAYLTVGVIIPMWSSNFGRQEGLQYRNDFGEMNTFLLDSLRGLSDIIQYQIGENRLKMIEDKTDNLIDKQKSLKGYESVTKLVTQGFVLIFSSLTLLLGLYLFSNNLINFKGLLVSVIAIMSSFGPVLALSSLSANLRHTLAAGDRVMDLLAESPVVKDKNHGLDSNFKDLKVDNVSFGYDDEVILDNYSLDVEKDKIIGLYRKSGSGKSTLLKLIMRFWDVDKGEIQISDKNIKDYKTSSLRDMQSYVTQDTFLFNDTLANNIAIAKKGASLEEIRAAAKKASIDDFIINLPNGYNTKAGELGDSLSTGEKQRIGIARIFLKNAQLTLLDEPTSNLDSLNEGIILKSIQEEAKNKTMIIVTHRKSATNIADKVYNVDTNRLS